MKLKFYHEMNEAAQNRTCLYAVIGIPVIVHKVCHEQSILGIIIQALLIEQQVILNKVRCGRYASADIGGFIHRPDIGNLLSQVTDKPEICR